MVKLPAFLKAYQDAGALHAVIGISRFVDSSVFRTKGGALGVVLKASGIDYETLTPETLESYTRRVANAWRGFDERFRIYQYLVKQDRAPIEHRADYGSEAVNRTVTDRAKHLEASGLYSIRLYYVVLLEPAPLRGKWRLLSKRAINELTANLDRNRETLLHHVDAFRRSAGELLGIETCTREAAFSFFRLLVNLDPETANAERLRHSDHLDYFLPSAPFTCTEGLRIGDAHLEVLSLREPPAATMPNVLRDFLKIEANFILCSEFKRMPNDKAVELVRSTQSYFFHSQWISSISGVISLAMNRGNKEAVQADETKLDEVEDLKNTLKRINIGGEYLGEFSFTCILYGWKGKAALQTAANDARRIFGNLEGSLIVETFNALNGFLSILPGNDAFNVRRGWMLSGNYADVSFLFAPGAGDPRNRHLRAEHLITLETSDRTPYCFSLHENDHLGALIFGAPGSGKSVLANALLDHSQKYSGRTFILDLGGSYRQITRKHGGAYLRMDSTDIRINPFAAPGTAENVQFLFTWTRALLTGAGYRPSVHDDKELFRGIQGLYRMPAGYRTLGGLASTLPASLKPFLAAWIKGGRDSSARNW